MEGKLMVMSIIFVHLLIYIQLTVTYSNYTSQIWFYFMLLYFIFYTIKRMGTSEKDYSNKVALCQFMFKLDLSVSGFK